VSRPTSNREQRKQEKRKARKPVHHDKYARQMNDRLDALVERYTSEERANERR
jgi:hypothetical protein